MTHRQRHFAKMTNWQLCYWLLQYGPFQAGHYPDLRRLRVAAEKEANKRGLKWWNGRRWGRDRNGRPRVQHSPMFGA